MPTLNIGDKKVNIDDSFLTKSHDEQQAIVDDISSKLNVTPPAPESWGQAALTGVKNIPSSAGRFASDIAQPFIHPIDTATNVGHLGAGLVEKAGNTDIGKWALGKLGLEAGTENIKYADAAGKYLMDRYGSLDAVKKTLATDPVGLAGDLSMVLTGGGTAARAAGLGGKATELAATVGREINPVSAAGRALEAGGHVAAHTIGELGTGTGGRSLVTAARAGAEGGPRAEAFLEHMRGNADMADAVADARQAVQRIRQQRSAEYRSGMAPVRQDPTILSFNDLDTAIADMNRVKTYSGRSGTGPTQSLSPKTQGIRQELTDAVNGWKQLQDSEFWTPEGFDALKQKLGDIRDATGYGTPERRVADEIYQAARSTIVRQVPEYAKVMKGYEEASKQIREIEKTLSTNPNATIDTALRKLQSVLRNNVNTNYGQREKLVQFLINAGAPHLMEKLAGQGLSAWFPRGLARVVPAALAEGAAMSVGGLGALKAVPAAAALSPRIMGETSYYTGKAAGSIPAGTAQAIDAMRLGDDALTQTNDPMR